MSADDSVAILIIRTLEQRLAVADHHAAHPVGENEVRLPEKNIAHGTNSIRSGLAKARVLRYDAADDRNEGGNADAEAGAGDS